MCIPPSTELPYLRATILGACLTLVWGIAPGVAFAGDPPARHPDVHVVPAPADCFVPDVVMDGQGVLHMVYVRNRNADYVRSADNGATWTKPVVVNREGTVEFKMSERGPKLPLGRDGTINVV